MEREIVRCDYDIQEIGNVAGLDSDPGAWLAEQAHAHGLTTLLAHAYDGVIWGTMKGTSLLLAPATFGMSPALRPETLQQARLFAGDAELMAWRDGAGPWRARLLRDGPGVGHGWCLDEDQMLWGDTAERGPEDEFTLVADGQQGLRHAVPLTGIRFPGSGQRPLRLGVRHYLAADADGMLHIIHSRLTRVWATEEEEVPHDQVA